MIELVVVIILLGIMSVYAGSRLLGTKEFSALAAQEQAISIIKQIQLGRMQSNIAGNAKNRYQLQITNTCLGSVARCSSTDPDAMKNNSDAILLDNSNLDFSNSTASFVQFDLKGNPSTCTDNTASGCTAVTGNNIITIAISDTRSAESHNVCINSQGYVYGC